jgi:hypothetical protein
MYSVQYTIEDFKSSKEYSGTIITHSDFELDIENAVRSKHKDVRIYKVYIKSVVQSTNEETKMAQVRTPAQTIVTMTILLAITMFVTHMLYVIPFGEFNPTLWEGLEDNGAIARFCWHVKMVGIFGFYMKQVIHTLRLP